MNESAACYDVKKQYLHSRSLISLENVHFRYTHKYFVKLMLHLCTLCICFTMAIKVMVSGNIGYVYEFTVKIVGGP